MFLNSRVPLLLGGALLTLLTAARAETVAFTPDRWDLTRARVVEHLGRQALTGTAMLKDVAFENGVIEVDVAMRSGARAYPGVLFRVQSETEHERIYLRPHRAPYYADAVQYVAAFNGVDSWQLYNGSGFSAQAALPTDRWVHLRIEVLGTQARIFFDDAAKPALVVWELQHGQSKGGLGLSAGPAEGVPAAFFSNFGWRDDSDLRFTPPPSPYSPPGFLREWEISRPTRRQALDFDRSPDAETLGRVPWSRVETDGRGIVDISRSFGRKSAEPEAVLARTVLRSEREELRKFWIGYSDEIGILVNGKPILYGNSSYRLRDSSFLGILGLHDAVWLPLRQGDNQILIMLGESMGGWGFTMRDASTILEAAGVRRLWASEAALRMPESVAWDPQRKVFYVSNYDGYNFSGGAGRQALSKLSADGRVETLEWVKGLDNPTGLAVRGDRLYVAERQQLAEIDVPTAQILKKHTAPGAAFLNDVAIADNGDVYVSDSRRNVIFRLANGKLEEWLSGPEIDSPNGVHVHAGRLIVVNNGDRCLKTVDLASKEVRVVATLHLGILDGVKTDAAGNYLVSHNEGRLLRVTPAGEVTTLLDLTSPGINTADFEYLPEKRLVVFPTFLDNRVLAYRVEGP